MPKTSREDGGKELLWEERNREMMVRGFRDRQRDRETYKREIQVVESSRREREKKIVV